MLARARRLLWILHPGWGGARQATEVQDWRLRAAFGDTARVGDVLERLRGREQVLGDEVVGLLPFGVVLTRNGDVLFAYASTRPGIDGVRRAIEGVAHAAGLAVDLRASHWDRYVKAWRQVDPPLSDRDRELDEVHAREASRHETRELSYAIGRLDRVRVEDLIRDFAQRRGL